MENNGDGTGKKDTGNWGLTTRFSPARQPSSEAKKEGWARKRRSKELVKFLLALNHVGVSQAFKEKIQAYFGMTDLDMSNVSNEAMIIMRQIAEAIDGGDNQAAQMLLERAYGKTVVGGGADDDLEEDQVPQLNIQVVYAGTSAVDTPPISEAEAEDEQGNKIEIE